MADVLPSPIQTQGGVRFSSEKEPCLSLNLRAFSGGSQESWAQGAGMSGSSLGPQCFSVYQ